MRSLLPYTCVNSLVPPNLYEDPFGLVTHRVIPARGRCVVVAIARNCGSTSNVFCRKIDNSGSGEGDPFQLRKSENRSFWTNEEVTNERLKFGCLLEYRVVTCHQSLLGRCSELGEQDGKQFIFHRNAGTEPQNVDKILLDLQDDESVHGGLQEALEYYNQKDVLLNYESLLKAYRQILKEDVLDKLPKYESPLKAHWQILKEAWECLHPEDAVTKLLNIIHLILVDCERLVEARKCFNRKDVLPNYESLLKAYWQILKEAWECLDPEDLDEEAWDLQDDESVDGGLEEGQGYVNQEFQGSQAHLACTRIFFLGIRAGMINSERVTLETMNGERLKMPLNCRESLVLSTGPVHLQLNRPWDVADDDVGGVAVVKYEAGKATCEGLILRYKPFIISRVEEPVQIQNACGKVIPVPGHYRVLFDTGNEVATSISRELLLELNLQPVLNKKTKVKLAGRGSGQFEEVEIKLIIRGYPFKVWALVDAAAEGTDLLVGMDIIQKLFDSGYTIGD